ncbi:hypothetical protein EK21DRAFT_115456 [Setomelanomma holmii]|uniref:Ankyrin repeat protein n=1 Tax=Setomelanomma holmii TaxID=210430 RepID=A0A9P4LJ37_9PLEO|nr:hypothetical protein EK21DRAFT_115456 [Setomelanomma holmii]
MSGEHDYTRFFILYGGAIIRRCIDTSNNRLIQLVKNLVESLLELEGSGSAIVRVKYTTDVCNALPGKLRLKRIISELESTVSSCEARASRAMEELLPAAACAVGNINLLQSLDLDILDTFGVADWYFPDAMSAAAAAGQVAVVRWTIQCLRSSERPTGDWAVKNALGEALQVAARTHRTEIGKILLDSLNEKSTFSVSLGDVDRAIEDCIIYGSPEFFDVGLLFQDGHRRTLETLLRAGTINPNQLGIHHPLDHVMYSCRQDLTEVLLQNGADINAKDADGQSALQNAAARGYHPNIKFLIEHGADPRGVKSTYNDVTKLLRRAITHATGAKLDTKAWREVWDALREEEQDSSMRWYGVR